MNPQVLRVLPIAVTLTGAIALQGCGGGGGSMTGTVTPVEPPTETQPATLAIPTGMNASTAPGVTARSPGDTIAALLAQPGRQFAPVSARSRMDEFHVKAIASDGNNGFRVIYVVAGRERTVHFEADDFGADPRNLYDFHVETEDGGRFWLDAPLGSFSDETKNQGSPHFEYHDFYGTGVSGYGTRNRQRLTFGARTVAANLPTGTASYSGYMFGQSHPIEYESLATRVRTWGNWRLTADFSQSTLAGDIRWVRVRGPDDSEYRFLPHTTYFSIENGKIVDGQFAASVSGMDSNQRASADRTLSGFTGEMLGEFYGPAAQEAGGVLRATRASDNRVLVGAFGGKRMPELNPSLPDGDLSQLSVGIHRDYVGRSVQLHDGAEVTAIERDGAGGFHVTYSLADGTDHQVHLEEHIYFNRHDEFGLLSHEAAGTFTLMDQTGSFAGTPEFSHFDVHGWTMGRYAADGTLQSVFRGFVVSGVPTESNDLPAGTATYTGRAHFAAWPTDNPFLNAGSRADGRLTLNADFSASTVDGIIDQIPTTLSAISEVAIENGVTRSGHLMAELRGAQGNATFDGNLTGQFFGPGAPEVGGVLEGAYTEGQTSLVVHGWFGGDRQ